MSGKPIRLFVSGFCALVVAAFMGVATHGLSQVNSGGRDVHDDEAAALVGGDNTCGYVAFCTGQCIFDQAWVLNGGKASTTDKADDSQEMRACCGMPFIGCDECWDSEPCWFGG